MFCPVHGRHNTFAVEGNNYSKAVNDQCAGWFCVTLTQERVILERGTLIEKMLPLCQPVGGPVEHFLG